MLEAPVHYRRPSTSLLHQPYPQDWSFRSALQPNSFHTSQLAGLSQPRTSNNSYDQLKLFNSNLPNDFSLFDLPQSSDALRTLRLSAHTPEGSVRGDNSMQPESSVAPSSFTFGQLTPNSGRTHHHRESSLSSLGSAGPASPYNQTTSHPQVALSDGIGGESFYDGDSTYNGNNNFAKSITPSQTPAQDQFLGLGYPNYNIQSYQEPSVAAMMATQRPTMDGSMMAAASDYGQMQKQVANTSESSSTPRSIEFDGRSKMDYNRTIVPKLDRTMTDIYQDELFNPSFTITSAPSTNIQTTSNSPRQDVFTQRLQAAKSQHLRASQSPTMPAKERTSPFREGSQYAPRMSDYETPLRLGSAAQLREQQKAANDARELRAQLTRQSPQQQALKTISPKEAFLDYQAPEEDTASMPLFPQEQPAFTSVPTIHHEPVPPEFEEPSSQQSFASMATSRRGSSSAYSTSSGSAPQSSFNFAPPSIPGSLSMQQSYYLPNSRRVPRAMQSEQQHPEMPLSMTSMESSSSEYVPEQTEIKKPARTMADGGTYTCTYHGCTLRFETPAKLQKHKREAHRQAAPPLGAGQRANDALLRNSQAGPHKCERINPSTGKPCNTIFSRPYDLTRHEDTIHNANKQKVRCHLCTEEKKFSRNDAFTRHMRVVHPEVDFPAKTRRRGGHH